MNKSKFLKKSLAMVLAVMMIVAMIPLGASAAGLPELTTIQIGSSSEATTVIADGTTFKADISPNASDIYVRAAVGQGATLTAVALTDGKDVTIDDTKMWPLTLSDFQADAATATTVTIPLILADADNTTSKNYSIVLTRSVAKTTTDLATAKVEDQIKSTVNATAKTIAITVPKGYNLDGSHTLTYETKDGATIGGNTSGTVSISFSDGVNTTPIEVTSQSGGNTAYYTATLTEQNILTGFAVDGIAAKIDQTNDEINVVIPAEKLVDENGKALTKLSLPVTFSKAFAGATATLEPKAPTSGAAAAFTSGTKIDFEPSLLHGYDYKAEFTVTYNNTDNDYALTVTTTKSKDNTISKATIANENATIEGSVIKAELAKGVDLTTIDEMSFTVSEKVAGITVLANDAKVGGTFGAPADDGTKTWSMTDASCNLKKGGSVTVEAADGTVKVYTISVTNTAVVNEPTISSMTLQDADEVNYTAVKSGNTFTFEVPYMTIDMSAWKFFFTGTTNTAYTNTSGDTLKTGDALGTRTIANANQITDTLTGQVIATSKSTDGGKSTYNVVIKLAAANNSRKANVTLDKLSATYATAADKVTGSNTVNAVVSSDKTEYTATIAYSATNTYLTAFTTKNNGVLFFKEKTDPVAAYVKVDLTDADTLGTDLTDGGSLLVLPEPAAKTALISGTFTESAGNVYTYNIAHKAPVADNQLKSLKVEDTSISLGTTLTATIPYGMTVASVAAATDKTAVFPTFTISDLATLKANTYSFVSEGSKDADGNAEAISGTNAALQFVRSTTDNTVTVYVTDDANGAVVDPGDKVTALEVYAENGAKRTYTLGKITYAEPNTDAKFTSFKLANSNATISGTDINVTVPYGTNVSALTPTFTVTSGAKVAYGLDAVTSGETVIDFSSDVVLKVTSEDGLKIVPYTVKVTVASQFSDVKEGTWYYDDVMTAAAKGWIAGVGDGKFAPNGSMKRGDFARMIANVMGADLSSYQTSAFPDVPSTKYYSAAIAFCADKGYISGNADGNFYPEDTITREQMARIICDAKGLTQVTNPAKKFADDAKIAKWAKGYVYACAEAGIFVGNDQNNFVPQTNASRCEGAAVLVRAFA